jgi:hypothetical protein
MERETENSEGVIHRLLLEEFVGWSMVRLSSSPPFL